MKRYVWERSIDIDGDRLLADLNEHGARGFDVFELDGGEDEYGFTHWDVLYRREVDDAPVMTGRTWMNEGEAHT